MTEAKIIPVANEDRIEILDVLRGIAVCGILFGNMQWFSGYGSIPPSLALATTFIDRITAFAIHFLVEGKFYSIFSFLFGFGFALQLARAADRGDESGRIFKRRLGWLLLIGIVHAYLLWAGDILSIYALLGFVLLLFRKTSERSLLKWSLALIIVPIITYSLMLGAFALFGPKDIGASVEAARIDGWNNSLRSMANGSYLEIMTTFNLQYIVGRYLGLIVQMRLPKILAMFLLGVWAYRRSIFTNIEANRTFLKRLFIGMIQLGIIGNLLFVMTASSEGDFPPSFLGLIGVIGYGFGVPALALAMIAGISLLWRSPLWQRVFGIFAPAGRMALTNYIMQTVVCVTIFYGFGFGLFGTFGAAKASLAALAIVSVQIVLSGVWLRFFAFGPLEWVWRQLTYGRRLSLSRTIGISSTKDRR